MSTQESVVLQNQASNGWQNIGICYLFAEENVPLKLRNIFMALVRRSFGYAQRSTIRTTQLDIATSIGISDRTFRDGARELESLGLIKIENPNLYKKGGGSDACAYSPVFPRGYGQLKFKDEQSASGSEEPIIIYDPGMDI